MRCFLSSSPAKYLLWGLSVCSVLPFMAGCNAPKDQLKVFNRYFEAGQYQECCEFARQKCKNRKKPSGEDLLWTLQLGSVDRLLYQYEMSTKLFDKAEKMLKYYDEQNRLADGIATTIVNDNALPYRGQQYDGVMLNTYKALNFMAEGDMELARVEINRALDRQRRTKEKFSKELQELRQEIDEKAKNRSLVKSSISSPKTRQALLKKYPNLYAFEAYPDFINPFATYLAGIFFEIEGDRARAIDLFKESYGMVSTNDYILQDLEQTENILNGNGHEEKMVWLIYENGLGPVKEEFRVDLPLFIATRHVRYVGIALPKLKFRRGACPYLDVESDGMKYSTQQVSDMDRVVQTEFKKDFDVILQRAIISATAKAVAQYALESNNSSGGSLAAIAVAIYSFATTAADVRVWTALPKEFQVARFPVPDDGKISINGQGVNPFEVKIGDCNDAIVYVRIPTLQTLPVSEVMIF